MQLGLVGLGRMGGNMRERLRAAGHEVVGFDQQPRGHRRRRRSPAWPRSLQRRAWSGSWCPSGESPSDHRRARRAARRRATSSSTAATRASATTRRAPSGSTSGASATSTSGSPAASGAGRTATALMVGGVGGARRARDADLRRAQAGGRRVRLRARRPGRRRALREDGAQRHRVRPDARLRRGLRAAGGLRARHERAGRFKPGARAPSSGPGCSTCWTGRSTRTRSWPS